MDKIDFLVDDSINVIFNIFRIRGYDGAVVVVVGVLKLLPLIRNTGVENMMDALIDQPLHMPVGQLCRVTFGFTRDRFNPQLIDLPGGRRREDDRESQGVEKCKPKRIIFVHVEYARNTDDAAFCLPGRKRGIVKIPF